MRILIVTSILVTTTLFGQNSPSPLRLDKNLIPVKTWFSAWELISKDVYDIYSLRPVDFLFFDSTTIYTTSEKLSKEATEIVGPQFFDTNMRWFKKEHHGKIQLPDGHELEVGLMSFAMPLENDKVKSIFIMPLPDYWKSQKVESKELGTDRLVTGVFLHEFAHSQQMQNFGVKISEYEAVYKDTLHFSDDLIQEYFEKDTVYTNLFRKETEKFYEAAFSENKKERLQKTKAALEQMELRYQKYFQGDKEYLREVDEFFLTMEGVGQYSMYVWLTHPKGGNIPKEAALKGVRRGGRWWSQEEGFAVVLLLSEYYRPGKWAQIMFGDKAESSLELLKKKVN